LFWNKGDDSPQKNKDGRSDASDLRTSFRVRPLSDAPVIIRTPKGKKANILNISSGGLCFKSQKLKAGKQFKVNLIVSESVPAFLISLEVMSSYSNLACCKFLNPSFELQEELHHYVLKVQKDNARFRSTSD